MFFMKYRWIFEQFFLVFFSVLSYNYLIFSPHNIFNRLLMGVKQLFFKCNVTMMNANVNNSERQQ